MARVTGDVGSLLLFLNGGAAAARSPTSSWPPASPGSWPGSSGGSPWSASLAIPLFAAQSPIFSGRDPRLSREIRGQVAALYALLSERVSAVRVVRSFAKEEAELAELDGRIDAHRALGWSSHEGRRPPGRRWPR